MTRPTTQRAEQPTLFEAEGVEDRRGAERHLSAAGSAVTDPSDQAVPPALSERPDDELSFGAWVESLPKRPA